MNTCSIVLMVLRIGSFGKQIRNYWKILNCDGGEKWASVGPRVCEMMKYYIVSRRTGIGTTKRRKVK